MSKSDAVIDAQRVLANAECLYSSSEIEKRLDALSDEINRTLGQKNPLLLIVMTGGFVFAGQLLTRLNFPLQVDYLHATRYRGETTGKDVSWLAKPRIPLQGRTVLVLDDILDEGHTLTSIVKACKEEGADSVHCAVMVEKNHDRRCEGAHADFVGLPVPDKYVFGYGLDYHEYLRNAPGIYAVDDVSETDHPQ